MNEAIEVQKRWLETLLKLSENCKKAQDDWYATGKPLMPTCVSKLIGFASSAESILEFNNQ